MNNVGVALQSGQRCRYGLPILLVSFLDTKRSARNGRRGSRGYLKTELYIEATMRMPGPRIELALGPLWVQNLGELG